MKRICHFLCLFIGFNAFSQGNVIYFNFQNNINLWSPSIEQQEESTLKNIDFNSFQIDISSQIYSKKKFTVHFALGYKKIKYVFYDRITNWNFIVHYPPYEELDYYEVNYKYEYPADLIAYSNSFGIGTDNNYRFFTKKHMFGEVGVNYRFFLLEFYHSEYTSPDPINSDPTSIYYEYRPQPNNGPANKFFLSSINLSTYYRHVFQLHEKFSLAARVSIGTNLYSDWDQFKKYAWLGLGLEMGFGKVRELKKKEEPAEN